MKKPTLVFFENVFDRILPKREIFFWGWRYWKGTSRCLPISNRNFKQVSFVTFFFFFYSSLVFFFLFSFLMTFKLHFLIPFSVSGSYNKYILYIHHSMTIILLTLKTMWQNEYLLLHFTLSLYSSSLYLFY